MYRKIEAKKKIFNPILRTYFLELRLRWRKVLFSSFSTVVFVLLFSSFYPYHFNKGEFYRDEITYFKFFILFVSCFFFSDIVCSEFTLKTGYIMFPKINRYKLIVGKYIANLSIIIFLLILHYLTLNISVMIIYESVILEWVISLGIAIMYAITLSAFILLFSTIIPKVNLTIILIILIYFIGFTILEQVFTAVNQELEPIFSLNYIGNLINHVVPGGLPNYQLYRGQLPWGQRWNWVYYAGDTLPPVKLWLTPTIEVAILIMSFYIALFFLLTFLVLKRKEF